MIDDRLDRIIVSNKALWKYRGLLGHSMVKMFSTITGTNINLKQLPLHSGVVDYTDESTTVYLVFKAEGGKVKFTLVEPIRNLSVRWVYDGCDINTDSSAINQKDDVVRICRFMTDLFLLVMYCMLKEPERVAVSEEKVSRVKKKQKPGKKPKRKVTYITRKVYTVTIKEPTDGDENTEKRKYERRTEAWGVRGHWRVYKKTGKRVWIPAHVKGKGTKEPKTYKLTEGKW